MRTLKNLEALHKEIGPLRYQMSDSDCVPVTVVNALMMVTKTRLNPQLLKLVWNLSMDRGKEGTGWVCSKLLAHVLQSWFDLAVTDGYADQKLPFNSKIIKGKSVLSEKENNSIHDILDAGGVICITTNEGTHYSLLHSKIGGRFLGFDPDWSNETKPCELSEKYHGMVNFSWSESELTSNLESKENQWIHVIRPNR